MDGGKQTITAKRARRFRILYWVHFVILAVGVPAIVIAIDGYCSVSEVIFLFGLGALLAWSSYWTNWVNLIILAVGMPVYFLAFHSFRSIWEVIILFGMWGFIAWQKYIFMWARKRIYEESDEDKK
jgi:hypothetical protein